MNNKQRWMGGVVLLGGGVLLAALLLKGQEEIHQNNVKTPSQAEQVQHKNANQAEMVQLQPLTVDVQTEQRLLEEQRRAREKAVAEQEARAAEFLAMQQQAEAEAARKAAEEYAALNALRSGQQQSSDNIPPELVEDEQAKQKRLAEEKAAQQKKLEQQKATDAKKAAEPLADLLRLARPALRVAEQRPLLQRLAHHRVEGVLRRLSRQQRQRQRQFAMGIGPGLRQQLAPGLAQHFRLGDIVGDLEARRHIRLERRRLQHAGAEGVDGLDLQPARRLQRLGEQPAGGRLALGRRGLPGQLRQRLAEFGVVHRRPGAQHLEDAVGHIGGGRLGVGDAEHAAGRDAVEQQAQHAVDQDMRLARAGIGRDPGAQARLRGQRLALIGQRGDDPARLHASSSSPAAADHSLTRARWS